MMRLTGVWWASGHLGRWHPADLSWWHLQCVCVLDCTPSAGSSHRLGYETTKAGDWEAVTYVSTAFWGV